MLVLHKERSLSSSTIIPDLASHCKERSESSSTVVPALTYQGERSILPSDTVPESSAQIEGSLSNSATVPELERSKSTSSIPSKNEGIGNVLGSPSAYPLESSLNRTPWDNSNKISSLQYEITAASKIASSILMKSSRPSSTPSFIPSRGVEPGDTNPDRIIHSESYVDVSLQTMPPSSP